VRVTQPVTEETTAGLSAEQRLVVESRGWPHSFEVMEQGDEEGRPRRYETWSYYDGGITYIFVDGAFVTWRDAELQPLTLVPWPYRPNQFTLGDGADRVEASLAGHKWLTLAGLEALPHLQVNGSDMRLLGFEGGRLVLVEALA